MKKPTSEARRYANGGMLCIIAGAIIVVIAVLTKLSWLVTGGLAGTLFGCVVVIYARTLHRRQKSPD